MRSLVAPPQSVQFKQVLHVSAGFFSLIPPNKRPTARLQEILHEIVLLYWYLRREIFATNSITMANATSVV